jgi:membrane protein
MRRLKLFWILLKRTYKGWGEDNVTDLAAAIAYYTIFSIPPILIILMSAAGSIFDGVTAKNQLIAQIGGFIGQGTADFIESLLENTAQKQTGGIASLVGAVVLLAGALGIFFHMQYALNIIWKVPKKPAVNIIKTITERALSFLVVLGISALFLIILILSSVLSFLIGKVDGLKQNVFLLETINFLVFFITITILIAIVYRVIPDKEISWTDVWLGAAVTGLLFMLGKYAIGFYLSLSNFGTAYGTAGSLIILLIWIYYSLQIFLLGAEFTHAYSMSFGARLKPKIAPTPTIN